MTVSEEEFKEFQKSVDLAIAWLQKLREDRREDTAFILQAFEGGALETIGHASSWKELAAATWLLCDLYEGGGREELGPIVHILCEICEATRDHNSNESAPKMTHPGSSNGVKH